MLYRKNKNALKSFIRPWNDFKSAHFLVGHSTILDEKGKKNPIQEKEFKEIFINLTIPWA